MASRIAVASGARVLTLDYRLAPEHPFPAAVHDAVAAYRWLLSEGTPASQIALAGDSAGGGLAVALLLSLREQGLELPAAGVLICPWVDLADPADDPGAATLDLLTSAMAAGFSRCYLGDTDARNPLASPIHADLGELPPLLVHAGGVEILRSQIERFAARVEEAGGDVTLEVADGMVHVWHMLTLVSPEARAAIERIGAFVRTRVASIRA